MEGAREMGLMKKTWKKRVEDRSILIELKRSMQWSWISGKNE